MAAPRPTPAAIRRAIEGMQAAKIPVQGVHLLRDGSVLILANAEAPTIASPKSEVDAWDEATGL